MKVVIALCLCVAAAFSPRTAAKKIKSRPQTRRLDLVKTRAATAPIMVTGGGGEVAPPKQSVLLKYRTPLLFVALIAQKVAADTLTGYTRSRGSYSGATVSMLSEVAKFPVLAAAICAFGGGWKRILPTAKAAVTNQPLNMAWIAGAYAAQNVLYFVALGHISAASYQVLSQSKMIFTAMLAVVMLKERLSTKKVASIGALLAGSLMVQFSEMAPGGAAAAAAAGSRDAVYGGLVTVLGAMLSALPNVWYEKLLKTEGEDEWVRNVQVTTWIFSWIALSQIFEASRTIGLRAVLSTPKAVVSALFGGTGLEGFTPLVWVIVALKALNGILIPATLKYAGNLVYLYAKPTSIVLTAAAVAVYSRAVPSLYFAGGAGLVIWSMIAFSSPSKEAAPKKD